MSIDFASFIGLAIPKKVSAYATGMREYRSVRAHRHEPLIDVAA